MKEMLKNECSEDILEKYYSAGYASLDKFLYECFDSNILFFEDEPSAAYDGNALNKVAGNKDFILSKHKLLQHGASLMLSPNPVYIEFGTRAGVSMKAVAEKMPIDSILYGLDTFTGLPEPWIPLYGNRGQGIVYSRIREQGDMGVDKFFETDDKRIILIKGLFQDTLPTIISHLHIHRPPLFINIDCDIYSGALYALTMLHPYIKKGDLIYFDEFVDEINEYAAFNDYVRSFHMKERFKAIGRAYDGFLFQII